MAIFQRAPDLSCELAGDSLPQSPVTNDVVQHLPSVNVLEYHVVVVLMNDHFSHATDIRMIEQHRERGFAEGADLFGGIPGGLTCCGVIVDAGAVCLRWRVWVDAGQDLDGELQ